MGFWGLESWLPTQSVILHLLYTCRNHFYRVWRLYLEHNFLKIMKIVLIEVIWNGSQTGCRKLWTWNLLQIDRANVFYFHYFSCKKKKKYITNPFQVYSKSKQMCISITEATCLLKAKWKSICYINKGNTQAFHFAGMKENALSQCFSPYGLWPKGKYSKKANWFENALRTENMNINGSPCVFF